MTTVRRWLVVGGGDLKFLVLLGMLEALVEADPTWEPDGMVGTSAGGLLVGLIASKRAEAGLTFAEAVHWAGTYVRREIAGPRDLVRERSWPARLVLWPWQALFGWRGVVSMAPLADRIARECRRAADWPHTWVTVYDHRTRQTTYQPPTPASILASASVPIAAAAVDGCADGGVREVIPTQWPRRFGAEDLVVCKAQAAEVVSRRRPPRSLIGQAASALDGMVREIVAGDVARLDVVACQSITRLAEAGLSAKRPIRVRFAEARQGFRATIRHFTDVDRAEMLAHGYLVGRTVFGGTS